MNAPAAPTALAKTAFDIHPLAIFAPSTTRTQARRRARFTKEELAELAANIKAVGVMQPIVARPHPQAGDLIKYEIVAGERRWLASDLAGLVMIPAIIRDVPDADLITLQLTENLQRKTIDQLEEAEAYDELRKARKINADQVADLLGVSRTTVFNRLKLLDLVPEGRAAIDAGKLSPSVALLVARLPDPKMQAKAVKGCLGDYKALGGFDGNTTSGPLTHEDAEKYIHDEFTIRLEGNAAISRAKSEGKAVIAGKEAADIWKNSYGGPSGHVQIDDTYWQGQKRKSYSSVLGENPAGVVVIQNPHTGAAVKCLPRDKAVAIFKEKKATLPHELQPRDNGRQAAPAKSDKPLTPAAAEKAKAAKAKEEAAVRRADMQAHLEADIQIAVFKAMRARTPAKLGKLELLEVIGRLEDAAFDPVDRDIAPRPVSIKGCTEKELVRFVIDQLYGEAIDDPVENDGERMNAAAKRYGVNVEKLKKEMTARAEAKFKEEEAAKAPKIPAAAKKWPFPLKGKAKKAGKK